MRRLACLILLLLSLRIYASEQLILVVAETFESPTAVLQRYVKDSTTYIGVGTKVTVNLGRNGLGWGIGMDFPHAEGEPVKHEGDGRAPAGIFRLDHVFGYALHVPTEMPYLHATPDLICVDDSHSGHYNRLQKIDAGIEIKSFEWMRRDDDLYRLGVTVSHNAEQRPGYGSCIFLHVEKGKGAPTSGCTSMPLQALRDITLWLDPDAAPLLLQIPKAYCSEVTRRFPGLTCP